MMRYVENKSFQQIPGTVARKPQSESFSSTTKQNLPPSESPISSAENPERQCAAIEATVSNPLRRELFANIVPSLGNALVKTLRAANNFKHDLSNILEKKF